MDEIGRDHSEENQREMVDVLSGHEDGFRREGAGLYGACVVERSTALARRYRSSGADPAAGGFRFARDGAGTAAVYYRCRNFAALQRRQRQAGLRTGLGVVR